MLRVIPLLIFTWSCTLFCSYEENVSTLYNSLDPNNVSALLAFYHLHAHTPAGEKAYQRALELINLHQETPIDATAFAEIHFDPRALIALMTREPHEEECRGERFYCIVI